MKPSPKSDAGPNAKAFAPDSPVDVPNMPAPAADSKTPRPDVKDTAKSGAGQKQPASAVDRSTSSWADNTRPAPDKKNARSSLF